jgi:L-threonylcarbamoyladenylate synthase
VTGHVVDSASDPVGAVAAAAAELRAGRPVVLPTDTVYGVAALVGDASAMADIFERKGRDAAKPMAVLVADANQASDLTEADLDVLADLWPGPLTVIVPCAPGARFLPGPLVGELGTIGLRCPDHDLVRALAAEVGPLATTSANRSGEQSPTTASEATAVLGGDLLAIDGGSCDGEPSTVVDLTFEPARIIREGAIDPAALNAAGLGVAPR